MGKFHECKVVSVKDNLGDAYQAQCSCGWKGDKHFYPIARGQAESHINQEKHFEKQKEV